MDYRDILIIFYLNSVKENYIYADLINLLGLTYEQVDNRIEELIRSNYLKINNKMVIELDMLGKQELIKKGFFDFNIFELYKKKDSFFLLKTEYLGFNDIYIPKNFEKKFQGY